MLFSVKINWVCTKVDRQCRFFCSIVILGHSNSCISVFPVYGNFVICSIRRFLCYLVCAFIALEIVLNSGWYFHTRKRQKTKKYRTISNIFYQILQKNSLYIFFSLILSMHHHNIFVHKKLSWYISRLMVMYDAIRRWAYEKYAWRIVARKYFSGNRKEPATE